MPTDSLWVLPSSMVDDEAEIDAFLRHGCGSAGAQGMPGIFVRIEVDPLREFLDGIGYDARVYAFVFGGRAVVAE